MISDTVDLSPAQITALRQRLGIPASQQSGTLSNADATIAWRTTPAGVEWTVQTLHSFRAKMAANVDPGEIKAQVNKLILGA